MANENETTTVINAVDQTAAGINSAIKNYSGLDRVLESISKREGRYGSQTITPEEWRRRGEAANRAYQQQASGAASAGREQTRHNSILAEAGAELAGMASKYLAVGYAIDKAREGFTEFAKDQEILRVAGARMGATAAQLEKFKEVAGTIGDTFGDSFEKVSGTMEAFRTSAGLTGDAMNDIKRIAPGIMEVSHRFNVDSMEMGKAFGAFVQQMNIAPDKWEEALGSMGVIAKDLGLDFAQLNRNAPELAENMSQMGATGTQGLSQMLAILAMTKKEFGRTTVATQQFQAGLDMIQRGGGVASAMGMDSARWSRKTEEIKNGGGNLFDWYIDRIKKARKEGFEWGELFEDPKQRRYWRMLVEGQERYQTLQSQISGESKAFHAGNTKDLENEALQLAKLLHQWEEFTESIGGLAASMGVTKILGAITEKFRVLAKMINEVTDAINSFSWDKLTAKLPSFKDTFVPSTMPGIGELNENTNPGVASAPSISDTVTSMFGNLQQLTPERRALGGRVKAGRTYMVGESGAEHFTPSTSGSITTNDTMKNVERHTDDTNTILTQIRDMLYKQQQDTGGGGGRAGAGGGGLYPGGGGGSSSSGESTYGGGGGGGAATAGGGMGLGTPGVGAARGKVGQGDDPRGLEGYIREAARKRGIDPDTAVAVAKSEGLRGFRSGVRRKDGSEEPSFGAFQLYTGGGLGNEFQKATGKNPADPANEKDTIDFALDHAAKHGWGAFHGAANTGIGRWAGIGQAAGAGGDTAAAFGGKVVERQGQVAGIRRGALDPRLRAALDYASSKTGLTADITSGGQRMPGVPGATGSHRHDGGKAGDFNIRDEKGNVLSPNDPRALEFYRHAARGGVTGGGEGYMNDPNKIHLDIDTEHYGSPVYAGSKAFRDAIARGKAERKEQGPPAPPATDVPMPQARPSTLEEARMIRAELEQPITIRTQMAKGSDSQFRRATMRREMNREVREANWNSYSDIGAA